MWVGTLAKVDRDFMLGGVASSFCKTVLVWQQVQVGPDYQKNGAPLVCELRIHYLE